MADGVALIVLVIRRYFPDWEPPKDTGREWISVLCPFHGDGNKSASISFKNNAFKCFACPVKGDAIAIIREQEGVSFAEALAITETISPGGSGAVLQKPARQSRRAVFGNAGPDSAEHQGPGRSVPSGVRGRSTPWA